MKAEWRRFAPVGLYLALLALIAAAVLFFIQREFNLYVQISLALFVFGLALAVFLNPSRARELITGRQARYGSNALVLSLAFIGIILIVNWFFFNNPKRWDLTEDKQYTLAKETLDTLEALPGPVRAQAFYTANLSTEQIEGLLDQYAFNSDGKFEYELINPDADPVAAQQAEITRDATVVLTLGDAVERVTQPDEQDLTGALVRLMNPTERTVYFLTGHGERSPEGQGDESYVMLKQALENKNYTVKTLALLGAQALPEDADMVVVAGPTQALAAEEVALLEGFVNQGGALVVMAEPVVVTEIGEGADPLLDYLQQQWGIDLGKDLIFDQSSNQPTVAVGVQYGSHPITRELAGLYTLMPTSRSVTVSQGPQGVTQVILVSTSQQAWAESDLAALTTEGSSIGPDAGQDVVGPVPMAVAAENSTTNGRVVVYGDSDFATNGFFLYYANSDLFVNGVDWAAGEESLINLTPKQNTTRNLIPPQQSVLNLMMLGTVILLPGLALVSGVVVWLQRRRRG